MMAQAVDEPIHVVRLFLCRDSFEGFGRHRTAIFVHKKPLLAGDQKWCKRYVIRSSGKRTNQA